MMHISRGGLDVINLLIGHAQYLQGVLAIGHQNVWIMHDGAKHIFRLHCLTASMFSAVARLEDLTTRIVVTSVRTTSTTSNNPSSVGVGCAMTYAAVTLNNSCENHLSLHF
ncbi:hypothetical protein TNCV_1694311 [Trichonephila clavipes]|nr:hypothetical protein TNCV_1694311 [Trichonephila clavipes]